MSNKESPDVGRPLWRAGERKRILRDSRAERSFREAGLYLSPGEAVNLDGRDYEVVEYRLIQPVMREDGMKTPKGSPEPVQTIVVRDLETGDQINFSLSDFKEKYRP